MIMALMLSYAPPPEVARALVSNEVFVSLLGPVLVALVAGPTGWFTFRQAARARKSADQVEARRVDAEAYERAQEFTEYGIARLKEQLSTLKSDLAERDQEVRSLRHRVRELEDQVYTLQRQQRETGT